MWNECVGDLSTNFVSSLPQIAFLSLLRSLLPRLQVQNLAMRGMSSPKGVGVKTEAPERSDSGREERKGNLKTISGL